MRVSLKGNSSVSINGQSFNGDVCITGGKVFVNGKEVDSSKLNLQGPISVVVNGSADSVSTTSGDITIKGDVYGSVAATSGDINVTGKVTGSVNTTSGDINHG